MPSLGAYYELEVRCTGTPDPTTGYVASISDIDEAVRRVGIPIIEHAAHECPHTHPGVIVAEMCGRISGELSTPVRSVRWRLSPFYSVTLETRNMDRVVLAQQFTFSAAHRLHVPTLGDAENQALFGKCNNNNGHGHNYRLEVAVSAPIPPAGEPGFGLLDMERAVDELVIQRFDHRNLNLDTDEFADLNPSVEHIAQTIHGLLESPLAAAGARLERITVWETDKTSCTFPG